MRKCLFMALGLAAALTSCSNLTGDSSLQQERDSLLVALNQKTAEFDQIMGDFTEISEGFRQINAAQNRVDLERANMVEGASVSDKIKGDLAFISQQMQSNREMISALEKKLAASNNMTAQLRKAIASLNQELQDKTKTIETLQAELQKKNIRIQELDKAVIGLTSERNELVADADNKNLTIATQEKAMNTAWFAFGTKKELKAQNILSSNGLFKKASLMKDGNANLDYFTECDIRKTTEINVYSKSANVLSSHPEGSYELSKNDEGEYVLHILDPQTFWSITKYLVIQVR